MFDPVRRKWVALTPEEWVRQHVVQYLLNELGCPAGLTAVERGLTLNGLSKRTDVVVYGADTGAPPLLLVECKAPQVRLARGTFEQAARYNLVLRVPYLMVTNGLQHYVCRVDHVQQRVDFLPELPPYSAMGKGPGE